MSKKIVIAFEGIEGSGKTFHIDNVSKYLKRKKIPHIKIREPGGNKNSEKIRKLILDKKSNFNRNTDLKAKDCISEKKEIENLFSFRKVLSRFFKSYISRMGFKEGLLGIIIGLLNGIFPLVVAIKTDYLKTKR